MKKILTLFSFVLLAQYAMSQYYDRDYKSFKVNFSAGYSTIMPKDSGTKGGVVFSFEPKYHLLDEFSIGIKVEAVTMKPAPSKANGGGTITGDVQTNGSILATGDYYFTHRDLRPFAGVGFGVYSQSARTITDYYGMIQDLPSSNKFDFMLRGGFEFSHISAALEYNFISNRTDTRTGYLCFKLGYVIGGGRFDPLAGPF